MTTAAVIGAGMAGLACAAALKARGVKVTVFEKARAPGGRLSTRRIESGAEFDHGAQYFTAHDPAFRKCVDGWIAEGAAAEWKPRLVEIKGRARSAVADDSRRFVGAPRMNALVAPLAQGLDVRLGVRVGVLARDGASWQAVDEFGKDLGGFDAAIVAVPAPQAIPFLAHAPALARAIGRVTMAPCWSVMAAFDQALPMAFNAAFVEKGALAWLARNSSKPGRAGAPETWVLHASPKWSRDHYDADQTEAASALLEAFRQLAGVAAPPAALRAHRWRYAMTEEALGEPYLLDANLRLGVCGDWCLQARVEAAWLSGAALGGALPL